jgi:ribosomal protein S17E
MGRIKTSLVKRITLGLIENHRERLSNDFQKNKLVVKSLLDGGSKKMVNIIAGYATRIMKKGDKFLMKSI